MARRPQPIIVPSPGFSRNARQTNVGIDLGAILELTGVAEKRREKERLEEIDPGIDLLNRLGALPQGLQGDLQEQAGPFLPETPETERFIDVDPQAEALRSQLSGALSQSPEGAVLFRKLLGSSLEKPDALEPSQKVFSKQGADGKVSTRFVDLNNPTEREKAISDGYQPHVSSGVNINIGDDGKLSKKVVDKLVTETVGLEKQLSDLSQLRGSMRPEFFTFKGKAEAGATKFFEKLGVTPQSMGFADNREFVQAKAAFVQRNDQFFNAYRKEITGAAASEQELKRLEQAIPSHTNDSFSTFQSKLTDMEVNLEALKIFKDTMLEQRATPQQLQKKGITVTSIADQLRQASQQPSSEVTGTLNEDNTLNFQGQQIPPNDDGTYTLPDGTVVEAQ